MSDHISRIGQLLKQARSAEGSNREDAVKKLCAICENMPSLRKRIASSIGMAVIDLAVPSIRKLTLDPNALVRAAACKSLGWLIAEGEAETLFTSLNDPAAEVREAAMGALIIIGGLQVIAKFSADLYHEDPERQLLSVKALGMIGEKDVVEPLRKALHHPEPIVRESAVHSLARIDSENMLDDFTAALHDDDRDVRKAAVTALVKVLGEKALPHVRSLLDDPDEIVRCHTIQAVAELGCSEYKNMIQPYLDDTNEIVRMSAAKALELMDEGDTSVPHYPKTNSKTTM